MLGGDGTQPDGSGAGPGSVSANARRTSSVSAGNRRRYSWIVGSSPIDWRIIRSSAIRNSRKAGSGVVRKSSIRGWRPSRQSASNSSRAAAICSRMELGEGAGVHQICPLVDADVAVVAICPRSHVGTTGRCLM